MRGHGCGLGALPSLAGRLWCWPHLCRIRPSALACYRACPAPCSMPNGRWRAQFTHRNKVIQIGMYDAEEEVRGA